MTNSKIDVAIIGAGPYGLSLSAHLRASGVEHRIFGDTMGAWKNNMPAGMLLKSYPWASCISDPAGEFTVRQFSAERALPYHDETMPLPLDRFVEYGEAFAARHAPAVEDRRLVSLAPAPDGFDAAFDDGETVRARRVVVAVGLHPFKRLPAAAASLPEDAYSHSGDYGPMERLSGRQVVVVGGGSSATDLAALLHERGVDVTLTCRDALHFAERPRGRSLFERISAPMSGIGHGWTLGACATLPQLIHRLPEDVRVRLAQTRALGPLGGAFMRDRVVGRLPVWAGYDIRHMESRAGKVFLDLAGDGGRRHALRADHVVFATGYRTDIGRLGFLSPEIRLGMRLAVGAPALSRHYESSVPGLHFVGPASANSFGPVSRFVYGTYHPSGHLARHFRDVLPRRTPAARPAPAVAADAAAPSLIPDRQQSEVLS